jgi:hypothetical protein
MKLAAVIAIAFIVAGPGSCQPPNPAAERPCIAAGGHIYIPHGSHATWLCLTDDGRIIEVQ